MSQDEKRTFTIIDRRQNPKGKSLGNVERFHRRAKAALRQKAKDQIDQLVKDGKLKDIGNANITVTGKTTAEPNFRLGSDGTHDRVLPGNKDFVVGDTISKPQGGQGGKGSKGSRDGEGQDDYVWALSQAEIIDILFDGLKLPDLVKTSLGETKKQKYYNAGTFKGDVPSRLHVPATIRNSLGRKISLGAPKLGREIAHVAEEILKHGGQLNDEAAFRYEQHVKRPPPPANIVLPPIKPDLILPVGDETYLQAAERTMDELLGRRRSIPYIEPSTDPRSRLLQPKPNPNINAVMFCLMDTSASMTQREKDMAKYFFLLEYTFLARRHPDVEVVFIRHTTQAREVKEEEFFHGTDSGGTVTSSSFELMKETIDARYSGGGWNIYGSYAGDGGTSHDDVEPSRKILDEELLPLCQYFAYLEVKNSGTNDNMMNAFKSINSPRLATQRANGPEDIYPVFRKFFEADGLGSLSTPTSRKGRAAALEF